MNGHLIQGYTNGDDAVFASKYFICANDGVGAWSMRPRGHAGLDFYFFLFLSHPLAFFLESNLTDKHIQSLGPVNLAFLGDEYIPRRGKS